MSEPVELEFFETEAELQRFIGAVQRAYLAVMACSESAGVELRNVPQAVLLSRLLVRMQAYKAEQAAKDYPEMIATVDAELEKLFPFFRDRIDDELKGARETIEQLKREMKDRSVQ